MRARIVAVRMVLARWLMTRTALVSGRFMTLDPQGHFEAHSLRFVRCLRYDDGSDHRLPAVRRCLEAVLAGRHVRDLERAVAVGFRLPRLAHPFGWAKLEEDECALGPLS